MRGGDPEPAGHLEPLGRHSFGAFARLREPALGDWMEREVAFPNNMVDRITPVTDDQDKRELAAHFGVEDACPVVCEPFRQWVLEDAFHGDRPPLQDAGVELVPDVEPYEVMKLRLLNGGHQALGYLGVLASYRYVHEVAQDPLFARFLLSYIEHGATPTVPPVPGVDLTAYCQTLLERLANPQVLDTLARLCTDSSDRVPAFLLPVVRHQLATGGAVERCARGGRLGPLRRTRRAGAPVELVDRRRDRLTAAAARQRQDPTAFLQDRELFGDLVDDVRFTAAWGVGAAVVAHARGTGHDSSALDGPAQVERQPLEPWGPVRSASG